MSAHVYSENFASKGFYASFLKTSMDSFCQISHNEDLFYFKESCQQKRIHGLFSPVMFRRNSSLFIDLQPMFKIAFPAHHFCWCYSNFIKAPFQCKESIIRCTTSTDPCLPSLSYSNNNIGNIRLTSALLPTFTVYRKIYIFSRNFCFLQSALCIELIVNHEWT